MVDRCHHSTMANIMTFVSPCIDVLNQDQLTMPWHTKESKENWQNGRINSPSLVEAGVLTILSFTFSLKSSVFAWTIQETFLSDAVSQFANIPIISSHRLPTWIPAQKMARALESSPSAVEMLHRKAEQMGIGVTNSQAHRKHVLELQVHSNSSSNWWNRCEVFAFRSDCNMQIRFSSSYLSIFINFSFNS